VSSQALARSWRPKSFDSIVGQEHVVKGLQYALSHNRLHHAYLFTGTRGVGKTTLARIFAKCLSCEKGISPNPCGECGACVQIDQGSFFDLIEIDAASRTKVEDTRELLDNVQYSPTVGRFKIYLIDEVHMLSTHSFNALLKTLEEPPAHVKFLLATTDPQKLPITVLSRCLQYHLRALTTSQLMGHLEQVVAAEGFSFEKEAISVIALSAKGSARDALSLLDQAIAFTGGDVRSDLVCQMLGVVSQELIYQLAEAIAEGDATKGLKAVDSLKESWIDVENLLVELARFWQECALVQAVNVESSEHFELKKIKAIGASTDPIKIQFFYQICLTMQSDLSLAPEPFSGFQMAVLRMLAFSKLENLDDILPEAASEPVLSNLNKVAMGAKLEPLKAKPEIEPKRDLSKIEVPIDPPKNLLKTVKDLENNWKGFIDSLNLEGIVRQVATHTKFEKLMEKVVEASEGKKVSLTIFLLVEKTASGLLSERILHRLAAAIELGLGQKVSLVVNSAGNNDLQTPARQIETEILEQGQLANQAIVTDTCVQEIQDAFGAEIDTKTVQLIAKK
jgi:DNA polymerase-3 subunit gamma/tau